MRGAGLKTTYLVDKTNKTRRNESFISRDKLQSGATFATRLLNKEYDIIKTPKSMDWWNLILF